MRVVETTTLQQPYNNFHTKEQQLNYNLSTTIRVVKYCKKEKWCLIFDGSKYWYRGGGEGSFSNTFGYYTPCRISRFIFWHCLCPSQVHFFLENTPHWCTFIFLWSRLQLHHPSHCHSVRVLVCVIEENIFDLQSCNLACRCTLMRGQTD